MSAGLSPSTLRSRALNFECVKHSLEGYVVGGVVRGVFMAGDEACYDSGKVWLNFEILHEWCLFFSV